MSTDLQPILDALTAGTEPTILTSDNNHRTATFVVPDGHRLQTIDLTEAASRWEHNAPRPRGTTHMHDPASLADYMEELTTESVTIPEALRCYVDWQAMARDAEIGGDLFTIETAQGEVHVFSSR